MFGICDGRSFAAKGVVEISQHSPPQSPSAVFAERAILQIVHARRRLDEGWKKRQYGFGQVVVDQAPADRLKAGALRADRRPVPIRRSIVCVRIQLSQVGVEARAAS